MARAIVNGPHYGKLQMIESTLSGGNERIWWVRIYPGVAVYVKRVEEPCQPPFKQASSYWRVHGIPALSRWTHAKKGPQSAAFAARQAVLRFTEYLQRSSAA